MNRSGILIFTQLLLISIIKCFSQTIEDFKKSPGAILYLNKNYGNYISSGAMVNGYREGKWIDMNEKDSTIYRISYFENGYPAGEWTTFYPDGKTKRKSLIYDHDHNLAGWCKYWKDIKVVLINKPSGFSQSELNVFEKQEEMMFETELSEYIKTGKTKDEYNNYYYELYYFLDIDKAVESFCKIAEINSYSYQLTLYYSTGKKRRESSYDKGIETIRISYLYTGKNRLKRKDYYHNKKLFKVQKIGKKGEIKKEKLFSKYSDKNACYCINLSNF